MLRTDVPGMEAIALRDAEPMYNLKAVVQKTGIPAASLRAWERRYGVLTPVRKANGHRVYPASEIEKLLRIKALMGQGMTISQAAEQVQQPGAPPVPSGEVDRLREELCSALGHLDVSKANQAFGAALDLLPAEQVCLRLIRPLLPDLAPFGRTYLRSRLGALLLHAPVSPTAPAALVMGRDPFDLEPLLAAVVLTRRAYRVIYVEGTEAPAGLKPDLVVDGAPPDELLQ